MTNFHGTKPDIVLIHCHDLGRWLSTYGMTAVPSPRLADFAERSVVFLNAHSAAPLCSPSRGAMFTGLSPHRNGVQGLTHNAWRYREGVVTAPERLAPLGYRSTLIGLQHENVDPNVLGFDEVFGLGYLPRVNKVVDDAEQWFAKLPERADRKSIFLTVGSWEVHRPWPVEDYTPANPEGVDVPDFLPDNADTREDIAAFYGAIRQLDTAIGRLLDVIDSRLDPETTMIVFTTDHGAAFPRAKSTLYDAGTGVSLIVRPPISWNVAPARVESIVSHLDVVPTLLDLAGAEPVVELEGHSLLQLLVSAVEESPDAVGLDDRRIVTSKSFHDRYDPVRAVRSRDYAYIRNFSDGPKLRLSGDLEDSATRRGMGDDHLQPRASEEFYDRRADPNELHNVVAEPSFAQIRESFANTLDAWMLETKDPLLDGPIPDAPARIRHVDDLPALGDTSFRSENVAGTSSTGAHAH